MRFSNQRALVLLLPGLLGALVLGCEREPVQPSSEMPAPQLSHGPDGMATASARLRPVNNSGVTAVVSITDDGATLVVTGSAQGLDPANQDGYGSAFYDQASSPQGPTACEPGRNVGVGTDHPLSLTLDQMTIGDFFLEPVWDVPNGTASLDETGLAYVSVDKIGTVSIRDLSVPGPFGFGTGPAAVVACGPVTPG